MKNFFTKAIYFIAAITLFMGVSLHAFAQHTVATLESGNNASAIAKDGSGNIYVLRIKSGTGTIGAGATAEIVKYVGGTGSAINIASNIPDEDQPGDWATGLAVASNGDVYYITDNGGSVPNGNIMKLTYQGGNSYSAATVFKAGTGTQGFYTALAMDSGDHLYAVQYDFNGDSNRNGIGSYTVIEFTSLASNSYTTLYQKLGEPGLDNAQNGSSSVTYTVPTGLAINAGGDVFVSDGFSQGAAINDGGKIFKLTKSSGYSASTISTGFSATALSLDAAGNLFASQGTSTTVPATSYGLYEYTGATATQSPTLVYSPLHEGGTLYPFGIAIINDNDIFVTDGEDPANSFSNKVLQIFGVPATQATNVTFSNTAATATTASWTNGDGTSRAVFIKQATTGSPAPVNSTSYTANVNYTSGSSIGGTGWYCVYNGTGTTVNITGLTTGQTYRVMAVEYNGIKGGSDENYLQTTGTNNPNNVTALAGETITFNALPTKTYGDVDFAPGATSTNNAVAITYASDNTAVATIVSGNIHIVGQGTAHITASQAGDASHTAAADVVQLLTVNKAALTITANNQTKAYGAALPTLTASYTGFVNSETSAILTTQPTLSTTATAASHVAGSPYSITASGAAAANYTISYVAGSLSVTTVPLTVTADNQTKAYGAAIPTLTASYTGLVNGDTGASLTTQPTVSTAATAASPVSGSPYAITASGAVDADYSISYVAGTLTITTAPLTITADNQTKVYGAAVPILTASFTGFVNGDTGASLTTQPTLSTAATAASHVAGNPYSITASGAVDPNYSISYVAGTLTVSTAALTVTADDQSMAYGAAVPTLTASYSGFVNGDTQSSLTTLPTLSTTATSASAPGSYPITASGAADADYSFSYVPGTLTVIGASDATLAGLSTTANSLTPTFDPTTTSYTASVPNAATSVTVTPTLTDANATIQVRVNGGSYSAVASGSTSGLLALNPGSNPIDVLVTAQDGATTKTYTITVTRTPLTNALLSSLTFDPYIKATAVSGPDYKDYIGSVNNTVTSITVKPVTQDPTATVKVNGVTVTSGTSSASIPLSIGANVINTVVTAQDGITTKTYSITVTRQGNALLSTLTFSPPLTITQVAGPDYRNYKGSMPSTVSSVQVTPTAEDPSSTIKVNGIIVASGGTSDPIALNMGANTINTVVTAADGITTKTYSIVITRTYSTLLTSLTFNPFIKATTVSGPDYKDYTATVSNSVSSVKVTPLAQDPTSTIKVNGVTVASGTASAAIPLNVGDNTITTVVTAFDGSSTRTYSITITRQVNALLASLTFSPRITTTAVSGPDYKDYTATVSNAISSVTVTPVTQDPTSTVTVNGITVPSGTASAAIPLNVGDNTVATVVTAQDGTTMNTYSTVITRLAPPGGASLYDEKLVAVAPVRNTDIVVHQNISPNGDGNSDVLLIDGITTYPDNTLQIMSRNGQLVYEAKGYDNATKVFDGHSSINGKLQQPGTYFYSLEYKLGTEIKHKTGYLVLKY